MMMLMLCSLSIASFGQDYQIGHTTINFIDGSRDGRSIPTEIYYPADTAGDNVSFPAGNADKFPSIVFGHGFVMTWDAYQNIWEGLVPKGFIIAFPKTEGGILPSHLDYGKDLAFVADEVKNLGTLSSNTFYQRVAPLNAVMGHSMGGGAAFLAAQLNTSITTLVTLAPAETNPSAIGAAGSISIPALVISGGNDCVAPAAANQLPMYNALLSSCKTYVSINGGSHCQMANSNFLCQLGEATCSPSAEISRDTQHQILNDYLVSWLEAQLQANCVAGAAFNNLIATDSRVAYEKNCDQCEALAVSETLKEGLEVYPNPFSNQITIHSPDNTVRTIAVYDATSRLILQQDIIDMAKIETGSFESGIYFYTISKSGSVLKKGKIVKRR